METDRTAARRGLAVAVILTTAMVLTGSTAVFDRPDFYGVNAQYVFGGTPGQRDRTIASMARAGIGVVRKDAFWSDAEPRPPVGSVRTFNWRENDEIAGAVAAHRLSWLALLGYGTSWATSHKGPDAWMSPPDDPRIFAGYAAAFAARYGRGGRFWREHQNLPYMPVEDYEIWNEPDITFGESETAPIRYSELFRAASRAIRTVDPQARVIIGGLSSRKATSFLLTVKRNDPAMFAQADAVGFHPYGANPDQTMSRIRDLRATLRTLGLLRLGIDVTETGWAAPPSVEADRAGWIRELAATLPTSNCHVTRFIVHTWTSPERDSRNAEDWFGIANADGRWKPTAAAFRDGIDDARSGGQRSGTVDC